MEKTRNLNQQFCIAERWILRTVPMPLHDYKLYLNALTQQMPNITDTFVCPILHYINLFLWSRGYAIDQTGITSMVSFLFPNCPSGSHNKKGLCSIFTLVFWWFYCQMLSLITMSQKTLINMLVPVWSMASQLQFLLSLLFSGVISASEADTCFYGVLMLTYM